MDSRTDLNNPARLPATIDIPPKEYNPKAQQTWREWIGDKVKWVRNHPVEAAVLGVTGAVTIVGTAVSLQKQCTKMILDRFSRDSLQKRFEECDKKKYAKFLKENVKTLEYTDAKNELRDFSTKNVSYDNFNKIQESLAYHGTDGIGAFIDKNFKDRDITSFEDLKNHTAFNGFVNKTIIPTFKRLEKLMDDYKNFSATNSSDGTLSYHAEFLANFTRWSFRNSIYKYMYETHTFGTNKLVLKTKMPNLGVLEKRMEEILRNEYGYDSSIIFSNEGTCLLRNAIIGAGATAAVSTLVFGGVLYKVCRTKEEPRPDSEQGNNEEDQVPLRPRQPNAEAGATPFEPSPSGELMEFNTSVVKLVKRDAQISTEDQEALDNGSAFNLMPEEGELHGEYRDRLYDLLMQIAIKERNTNGDSKATAITLLSNMYKIREWMNQISDTFEFGDFAIDAMYRHIDVLFKNGALTLDEEQALGGHFCINLVTEYVNGETEMGMLKGFWTSAYHYGEELSYKFINYMLSNNKA